MTKQYQQEALQVFEDFLTLCRARDTVEAAWDEITVKSFPYLRRLYRPLKSEGTETASLAKVPYVCLRIPTGGGKTRVAAEAISRVKRVFTRTDRLLTLWLVPSDAIREQTLRAMTKRGDVVCETLREHNGSVRVLDIEEAMNLNVADLETSDVIIVGTMQAFKRKVEDKDTLNVYKENGSLMPHFSGLSKSLSGKHSLVDALRLRRPFIVVDEAHNQGTELAADTLARFDPSAILELTATPDRERQPSNVLHSVSATALQGEDMIKMPVEVHAHAESRVVLREAIAKLDSLQKEADAEEGAYGTYVRPVMLLQAQKESSSKETITPEEVKRMLMEDFNIPATQIAIHAKQYAELDGVDVLARECPLRFIITVDKLKEGWDCPFASVLCTFRDSASANAIEQLLGRILRQPYQTKKKREALNKAYAYSVSPEGRWIELVQNIRDGLVRCGFEKQSARELMELPQQDANLELWQGERTVSLPVFEGKVYEPDLTTLPKALKEKIDVSAETGTITLPANLTANETKKLVESFSLKVQTAVKEGIEKAKVAAAKPREPSASERGQVLHIPKLAIRHGNFWEEYDQTHLMAGDWSLQDYPCELNTTEFSTDLEKLRHARLTLDEVEKLRVDMGSFEQMELQLAAQEPDDRWDEVGLVHWLGRNLRNVRVIAQDKAVWLRQAVRHLIETRHLSIEGLAYRKFRLREALENRMNQAQKDAERSVHQQLLLEEALFEAREDCNHIFEHGRYVFDEAYRGPIVLGKHFFPNIGNLRAEGEEFECAEYLANRCAAVATWVRNVERKPYAFSLQTSDYRFYPDFIAQLTDGRLLVVEYKGGQLMTDAEEKRIMGELWAKRSNGKCLFVMPTNRRWEMIEQKIAA